MALWDDVKRNMVDWYGVAAEKTNELAKVGVRRYDIFGISRDIERQFSEMGSLVYNGLNEGRTDFAEDEALLGLAERVRTLEAELKAKEIEIEEIRQAERTAGAASAAQAGAEDDIEVEIYEGEPVSPENEVPADEISSDDASAQDEENKG